MRRRLVNSSRPVASQSFHACLRMHAKDIDTPAAGGVTTERKPIIAFYIKASLEVVVVDIGLVAIFYSAGGEREGW